MYSNMWDRAFVPSFYDNVAEAIRKSYSLRCLISEKKRDFWEKLLIPLKEISEVKTINLAAIGGNCTDTLYVYELEPFCDPDLIEKDESYWNLNDSIERQQILIKGNKQHRQIIVHGLIRKKEDQN